jgi:hypothetical protein
VECVQGMSKGGAETLGVKMKLWLDDERPAPDGWIREMTAADAMVQLASGEVTHLSLDHDLGHANGQTGYDVCLWLERASVNDPTFTMPVVTLHTANPVGRQNMQRVLDSIQRRLDER